jgi:hypothetical protein
MMSPMRKVLLAGIAALFLATGTAHACGCCFVEDPTGTPLNVRDKPNGKIIGTFSNGEVVKDGRGPANYDRGDKGWITAKDSRGRVWIYVEGEHETKGWVFLKYLNKGCRAS